MALTESIQTAKAVQSDINFAFFAFLFEIFLIILIARLTRKEHNFQSVATNGALVFMAAGTLLFDQRPIGFVLLSYAAFLLAIGIKEYEELKFNQEEWFGGIVKFFGHYLTVSIILGVILLWEYVVTLFV